MGEHTMARKKNRSVMEKVGVWAYVVGFLIALIVALISPVGLASTWIVVLAILGFIVGLLNIADSEVHLYLTASVAFIVSAWAFMAMIGNWMFLKTFMQAIIVFTAPGALVVSFKALYHVAKD